MGRNAILAAGAAVALMSLAGAATGGGISKSESRRIREREAARKRPAAPEPVADNLPGETNRQYAARMATLRAAATQEAGQ